MFDICPITCDNPEEYGPEPSLRTIISYYYSSHNIPSNVTQKLTEKYILQLLKDYNASLDSRTTN